MTLTPETRAHLAEELARLAAAEKQVEAEMAPLREQMKPFTERLEAIEESRAELLDRHGITDTERCEGCNTLLLPGDPVCPCEDASPLCLQCAPTMADMKRQCEEILAGEDEEPERTALTLATIQRHLDAGGSLDDKYTIPMNG